MKLRRVCNLPLLSIVCCLILATCIITPVDQFIVRAQSSSIAPGNSFLTYTNPDYNFEMNYPSNWEEIEREANLDIRAIPVISFTPPLEDSRDEWYESLDVFYDEIPYEADLEEYLEESIDVYKTNKNFEIVSQNTYSLLSGIPAYELVYTYTYEEEGLDDIDIKAYEIGTVVNNSQGYYINFQAEESQYETYFPLVKQSVNSFKINEVEKEEPTRITSTPPPPSERNFTSYSNPDIGINNITYPKTYELIDYTKEPGFTTSIYNTSILLEIVSPLVSGLDDQQEYIQIGVFEGVDSVTREDTKAFVDGYLSTEMEKPSFELIESKYSDLIDGFDTYKAIFKTYDSDLQIPLQVTVYAISVGDKLYWITFLASPQQYNKYLPIFDTIINSLDLEGPKSSQSLDNSRFTSASINGSKFIELSLDEWRSDDIDVIVLVNEDTKNQSSKYVSVATEAVQKWSQLLKEYSGNPDAWNFNVRTQTGNLETVQPSNPNTIILELVSTPLDYNYCDDMLGFASPHPEAVNKPVVATVLTSCTDGFQIQDLPEDDVYSTALHEFAHTLGLGHAFNMDNDLMCSYDIYPNGEDKETCSMYETTGKVEPSEHDIRALLYKYGNEGFSPPNRNLFEEGGLRPVFMVTGNNSTTDLEPENIASELPPLPSNEMTLTNHDGDSETIIDTQYEYFYIEPMARPHYDEGMRLMHQGQYDQAIASFDKALNIQPELIKAIVNKGIAYNILGDYDLAIETLDSALELDPNESSALGEKGLVYTNMGNHEQAISFYDKALLIDPEDKFALNNKALSLIELGKDEEALITVNKGLEIAPNDTTLLYHKAVALINLDNISEAMSTIDKVLEIDPNDKEALETKEYLEDL